MIDWEMGVGARRVKSAQGTIKILTKPTFSSDMNHFLTIIGGLSPSLGGSAQHWWETGHSQRDIKLRSCKHPLKY